MTLRHVVTIAVVLAGFGAVGAVITAAVRRLLDWQSQRAYTPPQLFTQVRPRLLEELFPHDDDWVFDNEPEFPACRVPAWVMVDKTAPKEESLAEFAGPSHRTVATIWAELDGIFTAKGMATT